MVALMKLTSLIPVSIQKILYLKSGDRVLDRKLSFRRITLMGFVYLFYVNLLLSRPAIPLDKAELHYGEILRVQDLALSVQRGSPKLYLKTDEDELVLETRNWGLVSELQKNVGKVATVWSQQNRNLLLLPGALQILDVEIDGVRIQDYSDEDVQWRESIRKFLITVRWINLFGIFGIIFSLYRLTRKIKK